jgi:hypothetical protein
MLDVILHLQAALRNSPGRRKSGNGLESLLTAVGIEFVSILFPLCETVAVGECEFSWDFNSILGAIYHKTGFLFRAL